MTNKNIHDFTTILKQEFKHLKKNPPLDSTLIICTGSLESFYSVISVCKTKEIQTISYVDGKMFKLVVKQPTNKLDLVRYLRSLIPNFIHSLDAFILNRVLDFVRKNNIQVVTARMIVFEHFQNIVQNLKKLTLVHLMIFF